MTSITSLVSNIFNDYNSSLTATSTAGTANTTSTTSNNGSTFLGRYLDATPASDLNPKDMFKRLSVDMGGDEKTITKDQLSTYIKKAETGTVSVSENELTALKKMQSQWGTISEGSDKITYANMSGFKDILKSMSSAPTPTTTTSSTINTSQPSTDEIDNYLINSALKTSSSNPTSGLNSLLNTLLTGTTDENDDSNANLIAKLTNMIAESKTKSTVDTKA